MSISEKLKAFTSLVELRTKLVSASSFGLGLAAAAADGRQIDPLAAALVGCAALAVDMGTTAFNSYFDWYRGTDDPRFNRESDKVLVHGSVFPAVALYLALALYGIALPLGVATAVRAGFWILPAGTLCLMVGFLYSGGPRPISSTPFGEPLAGGLLGSALCAITYYASSSMGTSPRPSSLGTLALAQGLMVASILAANNACDIQGDREAGRKTLAVLLGPRLAPLVLYAYIASALLVDGFVPGATGWAASLARLLGYLLLLAFVTRQLIMVIMRGFSHETKGPTMGAALSLFIVHSLFLALVAVLRLISR